MKMVPFLILGFISLFAGSIIHAAPQETLESIIVQKMRAVQALDTGKSFYLIEFTALGECVKCTITSTNIKKILLKDSVIAKRCRYVAAPVTQRRKDAAAMMEDDTIYDTYISITNKELSNSGITVHDKFLLLDQSLNVRYTVSADKYLSNNFIKELILECRKIARK